MEQETARTDLKLSEKKVIDLVVQKYEEISPHLPRLIFLTPEFKNRIFLLGDEAKDEISVGRSEMSELQISDGSVSGSHCKIKKITDHLYAVTDCNSTNGTYLNGRQVNLEEMEFSHGDVIRLGRVEMLYLDEETKDLNSGHFTAVKNMSPFYKQSENKKVSIVINSIIAVLVSVVIVAGYLFLRSLFGM